MRFALLACLSLFLSFPALGEDFLSPEKVVKVQKLYRLSLTDEILGDMAARTGRVIVNEINKKLSGQGKSLAPNQANEMIARFSVAFVTEVKAMEPQVIKIYARHLTDRELDLMIEMYSNPEMAAVMAKFPIVMEEFSPIIQASVPRMVQSVIGGMKADGLLNNL